MTISDRQATYAWPRGCSVYQLLSSVIPIFKRSNTKKIVDIHNVRNDIIEL